MGLKFDPCVSITSPKGANAAAVRGVGCKLMVVMPLSLLFTDTESNSRVLAVAGRLKVIDCCVLCAFVVCV